MAFVMLMWEWPSTFCITRSEIAGVLPTDGGEGVWGVLYLVRRTELQVLDRYEGVPHAYVRRTLPVQVRLRGMEEPVEVLAAVYVHVERVEAFRERLAGLPGAEGLDQSVRPEEDQHGALPLAGLALEANWRLFVEAVEGIQPRVAQAGTRSFDLTGALWAKRVFAGRQPLAGPIFRPSVR